MLSPIGKLSGSKSTTCGWHLPEMSASRAGEDASLKGPVEGASRLDFAVQEVPELQQSGLEHKDWL
eukprot:5444762-Amphidinium_carterae.1